LIAGLRGQGCLTRCFCGVLGPVSSVGQRVSGPNWPGEFQ
jgi:hypothetical protein